eukprot:TRINITY_DN1024_c0_g2_i10.p1 TRINITY_DN1024_c0_g2~~TRINITY_DN1024_c0_g2_i10.p1  ORF type:complete len:668 (-),score=162.71 TRINITY_DN1024_c0_g2_i10:95-2098(-)
MNRCPNSTFEFQFLVPPISRSLNNRDVFANTRSDQMYSVPCNAMPLSVSIFFKSSSTCTEDDDDDDDDDDVFLLPNLGGDHRMRLGDDDEDEDEDEDDELVLSSMQMPSRTPRERERQGDQIPRRADRRTRPRKRARTHGDSGFTRRDPFPFTRMTGGAQDNSVNFNRNVHGNANVVTMPVHRNDMYSPPQYDQSSSRPSHRQHTNDSNGLPHGTTLINQGGGSIVLQTGSSSSDHRHQEMQRSVERQHLRTLEEFNKRQESASALHLTAVAQSMMEQDRGNGNVWTIAYTDLPQGLQLQLQAFERFWTKRTSLKRGSEPLCRSTINKHLERLRGYFHYLVTECHVQQTDLRLTHCFDADALDGYISFLIDERELAESTICQHISALVNVLKYYWLDKNVATGVLIKMLKNTRNALARRVESKTRLQNYQELQRENRWLHWPDVLVQVDRVQRERDSCQNPIKKARLAMDYLVLLMYTSIPPSRCLEICKLRLMDDTEEAKRRRSNMIFLDANGEWIMKHYWFKNTRHFGTGDETTLKGTAIPPVLEDYLDLYRPLLMEQHQSDHDYLLVNTNGEPFTSNAFSKYLKRMFVRLTGQHIGVNELRSSFVCFLYNREQDSTIRSSVARAMRHSVRQAETTYDRRSSRDRKTAGINIANRWFEENREKSK